MPPPANVFGFLPFDPLAQPESIGLRSVRFGLIVGAHVILLWGAAEIATRPEARQAVRELVVRLVEASSPEPEIRLPDPPRPQPRRQTEQRVVALPVMTAAATEMVVPPEAFAVAPQPTSPQASPPMEAEAPPAPPMVTPARFDADYLSNPKPVYPVASRRLGEEGKVTLRVKVSPDGTPITVEIKQSCGFPRLDGAARDAVEHWRFVPARRGDAAIESWVSVPIIFSLQAS
jgi:periplasmic protein TonB